MKTNHTCVGTKAILFTHILIFILVWPVCSFADKYSGGDGSAENPYRIETPNDLNDIGNHPEDFNDCFILVNDINMGGYTYSTALIAPDASSSSSFQGTVFTGVFDGNDCKITDLTIDDGDAGNDYLGLFGYIGNGGEVKNLGLEGGSVSGDKYVGGLVGASDRVNWDTPGGKITNCSYTGSVSGYYYVGGLVGENGFGSVSNCYSTGETSGYYEYVGGLVGWNRLGIVSNCVASGNVNVNAGARSHYVGGLVGYNFGGVSDCVASGSVSGDDSVGGLVGFNDDSVSNCYSTGETSGDGYVGGLVGENFGSVSNCYSTNDVNGTGPCVGGLVGMNSYDGSVLNCFWDTDTQSHGVTESIGENNGTATNVAGLPTSQMQTKSTFTSAGWDFIDEYANGTSETWQMPTGGGYPELSYFHIDIPVTLTGNGTADNPYLISDANELGMVCWYTDDSCFKLTRDIDLSGINWSAAVVPVFFGCFDGDDYKLTNMQVSGGGWLGLFGYLGKGGEVRNLGLEGGSVSGTGFEVGGLVGYNAVGSVLNCYSIGETSGNGSVGGLVGENFLGFVSNCYSAGSVSGTYCVGGLMGWNFGSISNCYSTGAANGDNHIGGLVGLNDYYSSVSNCYSTGAVNGTGNEVGGLVGLNYDEAIISNCYSSGAVSGNLYVGGLVGKNDGSVSNCFWDMQTSGMDNSDGGTGKTTDELQIEITFTDAGWDFETPIWQLCSGPIDYPHLACEGAINCERYSGGLGTSDEPFQIADVNDLNELARNPSHWDAEFILVNDINVSGQVYSTAVIAPDMESSNPYFDGTTFTGVFDGNGCKIMALTIDDGGAGNDYLGLFGCLGNGGEVRNLGVEGGFINGDNYVGGLVGGIQNYWGSISIMNIMNCYFTGSVIGNDYVGGLVGSNGSHENYGGSIINCYAAGSVSGGEYVGGLVGGSRSGRDNIINIMNCYFTGSVSGGDYSKYLGGLCGIGGDTISNCYSSGSVSGGENSEHLGGLCGDNGGTLSNCYATGDVSGGYYSHYIGGLCGRNYYGSISKCYANVSVTGGDGSYELGGLCGDNGGKISNCYTTGSVTGGDYSEIIGGLCGDNGGTISNCYTTSSVSGGEDSWCLGGLVGASGGSVSSCYCTGSVSGGYDSRYLGGLCGFNSGTIRNCYATGSVSGDDYLGGLCGKNFYGTISNCYATGDVTGDTVPGGLIGYDDTGTYTKSFWDMDVNPDVNGIGNTTDPNVIGKSTSQMQTKSTFTDAGWDFVGETINGPRDVWTIKEGVKYPEHVWPMVQYVGWDGVDFRDYDYFAERWMETDCNEREDCNGVDLDFSDTVDANDLKIFFNYWLFAKETWRMPVAWWEFDEGEGDTAYDSANYNDGTFVGDPCWVNGKIGDYALEFDGDDYVNFGDNNIGGVFGSGSCEFTVSGWIKPYVLNPDASNHGTRNVVLARASDSDNDNFELGISPAGNLDLYIDENDDDEMKTYGGGEVTIGSWHCFAMTFYHGSVDVYLDNNHYSGSFDGSSLDGADGSPVTIGATIHSDIYFNGCIDDVRVYSRVLIEAEIQELYELGAGGE